MINKIFFCLILLFISACIPMAERPSLNQRTQLRVSNTGQFAIENLVVIFPEEKISFGDIPAGANSDYQIVSKGVYRYAAYEFEVDSETKYQFVIDWMGESPMEGKAFTYIVQYDPNLFSTSQAIQLVEITIDN